MTEKLYQIEEHHLPGKKLGRHVHFDERSRAFRAPVEDVVLKSKVWKRKVAPFDQGNTGSCTGNASVGLVVTQPTPWYWLRRVNENNAVAVYSLATQLDDYPGTFPPDDTGSSGLAALKACVQKGYIKGYRWGFGLDDALRILSGIGPCIIGVNWYDSFDEPDVNGKITISPNAQVRGGHEIELLGIDVENKLVQGINSWGSSWGKEGRFFLPWNDFDRLLHEDGEVACAGPKPSDQPG